MTGSYLDLPGPTLATLAGPGASPLSAGASYGISRCSRNRSNSAKKASSLGW